MTKCQLHNLTECQPHTGKVCQPQIITVYAPPFVTQSVLHSVTEGLPHSVTKWLQQRATQCLYATRHSDLQHGSVKTCTGVDTLLLYPVLVHRGSSTPGQAGANQPNAAGAGSAWGAGANSPSRAVGEATVRTRSTPHGERGMALRRRGLALPEGNMGKVRRGPGVCISNAGPSAELSGTPSLSPPVFPFLRPSLRVQGSVGAGARAEARAVGRGGGV